MPWFFRWKAPQFSHARAISFWAFGSFRSMMGMDDVAEKSSSSSWTGSDHEWESGKLGEEEKSMGMISPRVIGCALYASFRVFIFVKLVCWEGERYMYIYRYRHTKLRVGTSLTLVVTKQKTNLVSYTWKINWII